MMSKAEEVKELKRRISSLESSICYIDRELRILSTTCQRIDHKLINRNSFTYEYELNDLIEKGYMLNSKFDKDTDIWIKK